MPLPSLLSNTNFLRNGKSSSSLKTSEVRSNLRPQTLQPLYNKVYIQSYRNWKRRYLLSFHQGLIHPVWWSLPGWRQPEKNGSSKTPQLQGNIHGPRMRPMYIPGYSNLNRKHQQPTQHPRASIPLPPAQMPAKLHNSKRRGSHRIPNRRPHRGARLCTAVVVVLSLGIRSQAAASLKKLSTDTVVY